MPHRGIVVPQEFAATRKAALEAIAPIRPTDEHTNARKDMLFSAKRSRAGRMLAEYYLVYFLLVELSPLPDETWSLEPEIFNGNFVWFVTEPASRYSAADLAEEIAK